MDYEIEGYRAVAPRWRTRVVWFLLGVVTGWWVAALMELAR